VRYAKGRLRGRSPFTIRYSLQELAGTESSRPLLQIAPPMNRLDVLGMIVSPSPSHPFGLDMVGHNLVVFREGCPANRAFPILLDGFSIQQLPHFGWRPKFAIFPRVVWIFDALNTKLKSAFFPRLLAPAAEE